jgi:hypothetical protein
MAEGCTANVPVEQYQLQFYMKTYKHLFRDLMHNVLNTWSFFHLSCCYSALHMCVCCCCWQSGLCQYDKWPNIWDCSDKWQSPMKLNCTKLDGMLFFKVSIWLTYFGPGAVFQQARHTVQFSHYFIFPSTCTSSTGACVIPPPGHFNYY